MKLNGLPFILALSIIYCEAVEPPQKSNHINGGVSDRPFRSAKVQQVWEKADKLQLPDVALTELYAELKHHDRQLMELKAIKVDGGDEDGLIQARIQKEFNAMMRKYGMARKKSAESYVNVDSKPSKKARFMDSKLNKLWSRAMNSKRFTSEELDKLYLEFKHHEDKMVELGNLQQDLERVADISENSIERLQENEVVAQKESHLKNLYEEVEESYKRLHVIAQKHRDDDIPFTEPKVLELWEMVQDGSYTDVEINSIKEELHHFEKRLEKHHHFREELRNSAEKIEFHGGKEEASTERITKHHKLQNKVRDLADKVHKMYNGMKSRLSSGVIKHREL